MLSRKFMIILLVFARVHSYQGCITNKNKIDLPAKQYDLNNPSILILNDALLEISGISFYPKDSSVFAISDGNGYLFKIHLGKKIITEKWKFDQTHDFEDVFYRDSIFYVLESNGNIQTLQFSPKGDTIYKRKSNFPENKIKPEFESLYYDEGRKKLILICKKCENDKKKSVTAWGYDPENGNYIPSVFTIPVDILAKKIENDKMKFRASAATVNPVTGDLWILSAANELIVITDKNGTLKEVYTLNPVIFTQPEGICFTPWGDLIISNEAGNKYSSGTLFIFKPKKAA